jgi:hypothetical protein
MEVGFVALVLALVAGASAFAPAPRSAARVQPLQVSLSDMPGVTNPVGVFDPLGLATGGSDETLLWYRAAELKHGRVAMLATGGWLINEWGIYFPGNLATDTPFSSLGDKPLAAWDAVPFAGKMQILVFAGVIEFFSEQGKPHYTKGGPMGLQCDPLGIFNTMSPEMQKTRMNRELNNGRLAMIGIMSFIAASKIPGSVPAIPADF